MNISLSKKSFTPPNNGEEIFKPIGGEELLWVLSFVISGITIAILKKVITMMNLFGDWKPDDFWILILALILTVFIKLKFFNKDIKYHIAFFDNFLLLIMETAGNRTDFKIDYKTIDNITLNENSKIARMSIKSIKTLQEQNYVSPSDNFSGQRYLITNSDLKNLDLDHQNTYEFKAVKKYKNIENELIDFLNRRTKGEFHKNTSQHITSSNHDFSPIQSKDSAGIR